jgi:hypothetical protein
MDKSGTAENERFFASIKFILTYSAGGVFLESAPAEFAALIFKKFCC